ncbi:MAG: 16S rRNA (cytosine(1402)-N(4))-methyltransferase RsmH [Clostridia bacterium]
MFKYTHEPIMLKEIIDFLDIVSNGVYVDCTMGLGGHSYEIAKRLSNDGKLIGIDKDLEALTASSSRLAEFNNVEFVHDDFKNVKEIFSSLKIDKIDGCLIDLGVSSYQLDCEERGFSFRFDSRLDMRMDRQQKFSAYDVVNKYSFEKLIKILFEYGEESFAKSIAANIIKAREIKPIETTFELVSIIEKSMPAKVVFKSGGASKKTFQAIRIEVNNELGRLKETLKFLVSKLRSGGRICVLTFHSLEDRIVKQTFKELSTNCICPSDIPICVCHHVASLSPLTKKPMIASLIEQSENPRSTCAKLRASKKI